MSATAERRSMQVSGHGSAARGINLVQIITQRHSNFNSGNAH